MEGGRFLNWFEHLQENIRALESKIHIKIDNLANLVPVI